MRLPLVAIFLRLIFTGQVGHAPSPPPPDAVLTGPGQGQGQGMGLEMMGFYIMLCTVHTTQG